MSKFAILTPLGFRARTSEEYWQKLIIKHPDIKYPDIAELEAEVIQTLTNPDEIRQSKPHPDSELEFCVRSNLTACGTSPS